MAGSQWMALTASRYHTQYTPFTTAGTGWEQMLRADPRRWHLVVIALANVIGNIIVGTDGIVDAIPLGGISNLPFVLEMAKEPAATTAGIWVFSAAVIPLLLREELYVGG